MLTPARRRGVELLDDAAVAPEVRERAIRDVTRSNGWLGGRRAAVRDILAALETLPDGATLLDVGSGLADIPEAVRSSAARREQRIVAFGVDAAPSLAAAARRRLDGAAAADAMRLPFGDRSVDVVCCSQLLHHFVEDDAVCLLRELDRVARHAVVVSDLRRSWVAAGGFWLVSFPLRFHPITRHDGVVSVLRGFTAAELVRLVERATGHTPQVRHRLGWRLTARWRPGGPSASLMA